MIANDQNTDNLPVYYGTLHAGDNCIDMVENEVKANEHLSKRHEDAR